MENRRKESVNTRAIPCTRCRQGQLGRGILIYTTLVVQITVKVRKPINYVVVKYKCDYCNAESTNRQMDIKNRVSMLTARRAYFENDVHIKDDDSTNG